MLKINECFEKDVIGRLRESIDNINEKDCVTSFISYVEDAYSTENDNSIFENRYRKRLLDDYDQIIIEVEMKKYENKSSKELLEAIRELKYDVDGCLRNDVENCSIREVFEYWIVSDNEACEVIKQYMNETLDNLIAEENKTAEEKEIERTKNDYKAFKKCLESASQNLNIIEKKLNELGINVSDIK